MGCQGFSLTPSLIPVIFHSKDLSPELLLSTSLALHTPSFRHLDGFIILRLFLARRDGVSCDNPFLCGHTFTLLMCTLPNHSLPQSLHSTSVFLETQLVCLTLMGCFTTFTQLFVPISKPCKLISSLCSVIMKGLSSATKSFWACCSTTRSQFLLLLVFNSVEKHIHTFKQFKEPVVSYTFCVIHT